MKWHWRIRGMGEVARGRALGSRIASVMMVLLAVAAVCLIPGEAKVLAIIPAFVSLLAYFAARMHAKAAIRLDEEDRAIEELEKRSTDHSRQNPSD